MLHNNSLFKRFTVFSFIAFVITGVTLGLLISNHIRSDMVENYGGMNSGELAFHLDEINRIITIVMSLGLLVLYLLLMKIIYNASKTLVFQNEKLQEQNEALELSYLKLNSSYKSTITTLTNAVDARDPYTAGHSERVTKLSLQIGSKLGLNNDQLYNLELAALFHDIGKIGIPDKILHKPGKLTDEEYDKIKGHPVIGVKILENIDYLDYILPVILHHHERFEGDGYPEGIRGEEIPLESRIIAVADTYDAIISDRPYRKGLSQDDAVSEIIRCKGIQFDSNIVDTFVTVITEGFSSFENIQK